MGKLWAIFKREYYERVRTKWFIFSTLFGPLLFSLLIFIPPYLASRTKAAEDVGRIIILDATGTDLGQRIALELSGGLFGNPDAAVVRELSPDELPLAEEQAAREVLTTPAKGYLAIDPHTVSRFNARYVGTNATIANDMARLQGVVRTEVAALQLEEAGVPPERARALLQVRLNMDIERLTARGRGGSARINIIFAFAVAFLLYITIFIYGQNVLRGVIEEKQTRVAEVVVSSVRARTLLEGKVLGVGAVGLTQTLIWLGAGVLLFEVREPVLTRLGAPQLPMMFPDISFGMGVLLVTYFLLGYMFYASLFAAVGALVNSEQDAQQVQMPIAMLLVASALFVQPILFSPDGALAQALSLIPFSAPIAMPLRLSVIPVDEIEVAMSLISLVIGCYAAIWVAARIYQTGLLMYGKRPSFREIIRWLRYAP